MEKGVKKKKIRQYLIAMICVCVLVFFRFYDATVDLYNTTLLAFSYKYGFISRGLIGTIFQFVNSLVPTDLMNYEGAMIFTQAATAVCFIILFVFFYKCMQKANEKMLSEMVYLEVVLAILTVSMFVSFRNMGRVDIYMMTLSLIGAMLLIRKKFEWLLVPISAMAVMFHQGYVFMFFNIILVLLIYRFLSAERHEKTKYLLLFILCFCVGSALFLWFEFFSRMNGTQYVEEIIENAKLLSYNGEYHDTLIDHEILGIDLAGVEWDFHKENFVEYPIFLLLVAPYIWIGVRVFYGLVRAAENRMDRWKYICVAIGSLTIIPDFILKIDYARWTFAVVTYYIVVLLAMLAMGDHTVETVCKNMAIQIREKAWAPLLLVYLVLFLPFYDVFMNELMHNIAQFLNENWLHLWEHL